MPTFEDLVQQLGFLSDRQIMSALTEGYLLEKGSWDKSNLRHASYTLRLGSRVEISRANPPSLTHTKEFTVTQLTQSDPRVDIRPGDTALLYSMETLRFPECVLGFTVARGLLFAEGLCPENTYVDPGFTGTIYTTITNISSRVVQLEYGMQITRLFFFRLSESVQDGYRSGSALGISQQLKSVRVSPISTPDECRSATDGQLLDGVKLIPIAGLHAAESIGRLAEHQVRSERRLLTLAIVWPPLLVFANNNAWVVQNFGAFAASVAASIVAAMLVLAAPKIGTWLRMGRSP